MQSKSGICFDFVSFTHADRRKIQPNGNLWDWNRQILGQVEKKIVRWTSWPNMGKTAIRQMEFKNYASGVQPVWGFFFLVAFPFIQLHVIIFGLDIFTHFDYRKRISSLYIAVSTIIQQYIAVLRPLHSKFCSNWPFTLWLKKSQLK